MSEENEGRVTKKMSHEFSRTEDRILGALSKPDEFLLDPKTRVHSGRVPEISQNSNGENQEANDRSQNAPHPQMGVSLSQSSQDETSYKYDVLPIRTEITLLPCF